MALVRSAAIRGFRDTVVELGGDPETIAVEAGLPVEALHSSDLVVSDTHVGQALEIAARKLDCPDFGLRVGRRQDLSLLGPLGLAIQHSSTLAEALTNLTNHLFVHAEGLRLAVHDAGTTNRESVEVRYDVGPRRTPAVQGTGLVLGYMHRVAVELVGGPYGLRTVDLPHRAPDLAAYEVHFGVPVRENRRHAALRVTGSLAQIPIPSRDDELQRLAVQMLTSHRRTPNADVVEVVRTALAASMGRAPLTIAAVARNLSMHPRTLQRLLEGEDTSFATVLDDLRRHTAKHLLVSTTMPISQVAHQIGYAQAATFSRRAQAWWGQAPKDVRQGTK